MIRSRSAPARLGWGLVGAAALFGGLLGGVAMARRMAATDTRDVAYAAIQRAGLTQATVAFPTMPWFQTVPLSPWFSDPRPGAWRGDPWASGHVLYNDKDWDVDILWNSRPTMVIVSQYDLQDAGRVHPAACATYLRALKTLFGDPAVITSAGMSTHPITDSWRAGGPRVPHDMLYPSPTLLIWTRNGSKL